VGAENWIRRAGLQDKLFVDDTDVDGDDYPDIVVRERAYPHAPYIVKGYTTTSSNYPLRSDYYNVYPTASSRKGHSFREFVDDHFIESYGDHGLTRAYKPKILAHAEKMKKAGYDIRLPSKVLSIPQAFKIFIMKPIMTEIKAVAKEDNMILNGMELSYVGQKPFTAII
jgi:hypothetical protein